jgi:hypothetical protein
MRAVVALGVAVAIGLLPGIGWASSCLWVDMHRMDRPLPGHVGLVEVANVCNPEMNFAFGEWDPKSNALRSWRVNLAGDGDSGDTTFIDVKPDFFLMATPCQSDCKAEEDYFRTNRAFVGPAQSLIWNPPWLSR